MPQKNSLGKGLGAMFPDLLEGFNNRPAFVMCGIEELSPNRFQARRDFNDRQQQQLVSSIKKSGITSPLLPEKPQRDTKLLPANAAGGRPRRPASRVSL
jgi:ParB family chromosome partitioning protein